MYTRVLLYTCVLLYSTPVQLRIPVQYSCTAVLLYYYAPVLYCASILVHVYFMNLCLIVRQH